MGWIQAFDRAQRRNARRGDERRKRPPLPTSTAEERIDDRLRQQARRLNIRISDYIRNGELNVDALEQEIVRRTEERRKKNRDEKEEDEDEVAPPDVDPDVWEATKDDPVSRSQLVAQAAAKRAAERARADTFGDIEYEEKQGERYDNFLFDMNEDVSPQAYRARTLFEDRNNRTRPIDGRTRAANGRTAGNRLTATGSTPVRTSAQSYVSKIYRMDAGELESYQRKLYAAGFYGSVTGSRDEEPIWGAADEPTKNATRALAYMTMSFRGRKSINETLAMFLAQNDKDGDGIPDKIKKEEEEKPKPVIQLTSQVDLAQQAQDESVELMGRRLSEGEIGGATGGYNALESSFQYGVQNAQINNLSGTFTAPPSPGAYAENQLRQRMGAEIDSYTYLKNINHLLEMVGLG